MTNHGVWAALAVGLIGSALWYIRHGKRMRDFNLANWFGRKLFERARQAEAQAQAYDSFILEFRRVMRGTPITQQCLELEASE